MKSLLYLRHTNRCIGQRRFVTSSTQRSFWNTPHQEEPKTTSQSSKPPIKTVGYHEIKDRLAEEQDLSRAQADRILRCFLDIVVEEVADGKMVKIVDFGNFKQVVRKPRMVYNFQENAMKPMGERKRIKFSPFKSFREAIDEKSWTQWQHFW